MSVTNTTISNTYTGDGTTTIFPFTFQILTDLNSGVTILPTDVAVYFGTASTGQTLQSTSTYTVNGPFAVTNPSTVVFLSAPAAGTTILIQRNKPFTQTSRFLDGAAMPASSFELGLDKLTMLIQQVQGLFGAIGFQGVLINNNAPVTNGKAVSSFYLVPNPAAGGFWGWVCVTSGSPDTWKQFGPISF